MHLTTRSGFVFSIVFVIGLVLLTGCGNGYALRGKVIESQTTAIMVVDGDDPQLAEAGVGGVQIRIFRDPGRLSQELAATGVSRADGTFEIPISGFGAGWMDEQWLIETHRSGYRNAEAMLRLPTNTKRRPILIMLDRGRATPLREQEDLMQEMERYR